MQWICLLLVALSAFGQGPDGEEARRQAAIEEFTRKTREANYPALFEQAAREFNVPADVLKGIAFAETRWEHLTWPAGQTVSPENGMPRPYGLMSLWDNDYFGHSLIEAARLVNQSPETLKQDPLQNIRGAAALLRKLYDQTPKPSGTTEADIESWRYAIRQYCGIPEPELNARHALDIYTFMSQGYHQYGIEWDARPVDLESIRQETFRIVAEEQAKHRAETAYGSTNSGQTNISSAVPGPGTGTKALSGTSNSPARTGTNLAASAARARAAAGPKRWEWWLLGGVPALVLIVLLLSRRESER